MEELSKAAVLEQHFHWNIMAKWSLKGLVKGAQTF